MTLLTESIIAGKIRIVVNNYHAQPVFPIFNRSPSLFR